MRVSINTRYNFNTTCGAFVIRITLSLQVILKRWGIHSSSDLCLTSRILNNGKKDINIYKSSLNTMVCIKESVKHSHKTTNME